MKIQLWCVLLAVVFGAMPIFADVIYDNGAPDLLDGRLSDFDVDQQVADDFVLQPGATLLTDVHWYGVYLPGNTPGIDAFTIRIFSDDGGVPAINPLFEVTGLAGNRADTNLDFGPQFDVYEYNADITPLALAANTTYWISIVNDSESESDDWWNWITSRQEGDVATRLSDTATWTAGTHDMAFYLTGSAVVPEPASVTMIGLGLIGLVFRRRKHA